MHSIAPAAHRLKRAPRESSSNRLLDGLAIGVIVLLAAVAAVTFRDYGLGWDDYTHSQYGELLLSLYASGFADTRALSFVNLYMYGGGFDLAAALMAKVLPFSLFETRRLAGAMVGLFGLFITWRLGRRLGGPLAGLIALVLLATCPLYYGHMFMNPKDAPFAVAMAFLLLALTRAFEEYPRPSAATVALFGIALGLTIGSRIIGGLAAFYALAAFVLIIGAELRAAELRSVAARAGAFILTLVPGLVIAYGVMALIWPWSVLAPLNPFRAVVYFSEFFEKPWKEMFDGAVIPVSDMPRAYVPTLLALKLPEVFLLLGLAGTAGALVAAFRREIPIGRRAALVMIATAAILPIAIAVATRPAMYNGVRHFIFVMPPLAVLGGLAGNWLVARLQRRSQRLAAFAGAALLGGFALPAIEMVRLHPYQYTHFNRLAGGVKAADEGYMLDYWGLAFKEASQNLRAKLAERSESPIGRQRWRVAVCGPYPPAEVELGPQFEMTLEPKGADFALTLAEFYCVELKAPILVEVARDGVVFARVYDIRGHTVLNLNTIPPVR